MRIKNREPNEKRRIVMLGFLNNKYVVALARVLIAGTYFPGGFVLFSGEQTRECR